MITNFHFEVSADLFDEEELELIGRMRPGLIQLEIGVQSTNPDTIREIRQENGPVRSLRPLWTGSMDTGIPTSIWI